MRVAKRITVIRSSGDAATGSFSRVWLFLVASSKINFFHFRPKTRSTLQPS